MSLRSPTNSARIVECGAIDVLVKCMRAHEEKTALQRQGFVKQLYHLLLLICIKYVDSDTFSDASSNQQTFPLTPLTCKQFFVVLSTSARTASLFSPCVFHTSQLLLSQLFWGHHINFPLNQHSVSLNFSSCRLLVHTQYCCPLSPLEINSSRCRCGERSEEGRDFEVR